MSKKNKILTQLQSVVCDFCEIFNYSYSGKDDYFNILHKGKKHASITVFSEDNIYYSIATYKLNAGIPLSEEIVNQLLKSDKLIQEYLEKTEMLLYYESGSLITYMFLELSEKTHLIKSQILIQLYNLSFNINEFEKFIEEKFALFLQISNN